jgi:hypothetical protein
MTQLPPKKAHANFAETRRGRCGKRNRMLDPSAYPDSFARDHLPPIELWPMLRNFDPRAASYPKRLNVVSELLDRAVAAGWGGRLAIRAADATLTYAELLDRAIASQRS